MEIKFVDHVEEKMKVVRPEETNFIKCSNCDKKLAQIFEKSLSKNTFYELIVECPFCKDKSFSRNITGKIGIHPCDGVGFSKIETNELTMTNYYRTVKV